MLRDAPPTLRYATRVHRRSTSIPARWWIVGIAAAVPVAFVLLVHAMYLGDRLRVGRAPTPADASMWPAPLYTLSIVLFFTSLPCAGVAFFAGLWTCAAEHGFRNYGRMWTALALALIGPMVGVLMKLDPAGAFDGWFD